MRSANEAAVSERAVSEQAEPGNAVVEFIGVMTVIIIPALILLIGLSTTTRAQLALDDAARQSVRAYVRADSGVQAQAQARTAADLAWDTRGFVEPLAFGVSCTASPCLSPGASVEVTVSADVGVPIIGSISISASQSMLVDQYRVVRP
ncbi:hypothetical protein J2S70_000346 [Trueperella bonasi]|uniref:TadE-like protein n=1 Tax=Trueperella bonasi TaxID=312286 RepID=A0ABT9NEF4_9ACTO|nr:hypothetical protein [Trueperella bonasi]MDP9805764.1 hypothetical protein [Trueperella bonasi]